jgi:hypothetical protein
MGYLVEINPTHTNDQSLKSYNKWLVRWVSPFSHYIYYIVYI